MQQMGAWLYSNSNARHSARVFIQGHDVFWVHTSYERRICCPGRQGVWLAF